MLQGQMRMAEMSLEQESSQQKAKYYYFADSGQWKHQGDGVGIPKGFVGAVNHDFLAGLNGGSMPGISGSGKDYTVVIISEDNHPRLVWGWRISWG